MKKYQDVKKFCVICEREFKRIGKIYYIKNGNINYICKRCLTNWNNLMERTKKKGD